MKNKKLLIITTVICLALLLRCPALAQRLLAHKQRRQNAEGRYHDADHRRRRRERVPRWAMPTLTAIKYINEELGGVNGYKIEVVWLDSKYDAAQAVTNVKKFMDEGCLFFTTSSSTEMGCRQEIANRAEFPGLVCFNASRATTDPPQHIYGQTPDYGDDWTAFANYYMKNIWKGPGKPKMALHLLNNPPAMALRDAAKAMADETGHRNYLGRPVQGTCRHHHSPRWRR